MPESQEFQVGCQKVEAIWLRREAIYFGVRWKVILNLEVKLEHDKKFLRFENAWKILSFILNTIVNDFYSLMVGVRCSLNGFNWRIMGQTFNSNKHFERDLVILRWIVGKSGIFYMVRVTKSLIRRFQRSMVLKSWCCPDFVWDLGPPKLK